MPANRRPTTRTLIGLALAVAGAVLWFVASSIGDAGSASAAGDGTTTTTGAVTTTAADTTTTAAADGTVASTTTTAGSGTTAPGTTVAPTTTAAGAGDAALLAQGEELFQRTAGGVGCAYCHTAAATGNPELAAPDIRERNAADIADALVTRAQMQFIVLSGDEIQAIAAYLATLAP